MNNFTSFLYILKIINGYLHIKIWEHLQSINHLPMLMYSVKQHSNCKVAIHFKNNIVNFTNFSAQDLEGVDKIYAWSTTMYHKLINEGVFNKVAKACIHNNDRNFGHLSERSRSILTNLPENILELEI